MIEPRTTHICVTVRILLCKVYLVTKLQTEDDGSVRCKNNGQKSPNCQRDCATLDTLFHICATIRQLNICTKYRCKLLLQVSLHYHRLLPQGFYTIMYMHTKYRLKTKILSI